MATYVYKFREIFGKIDFWVQFKNIVTHYKKTGYNMDMLWQTACMGLVVQSVVSLMSSLRVISLTVLADSIHYILIFFAEKM